MSASPLHSTKQSSKRQYRVFLLGKNGRITGSQDLNAETDEEAVAAALSLRLTCGCEVWERARVVAELPPPRP